MRSTRICWLATLLLLLAVLVAPTSADGQDPAVEPGYEPSTLRLLHAAENIGKHVVGDGVIALSVDPNPRHGVVRVYTPIQAGEFEVQELVSPHGPAQLEFGRALAIVDGAILVSAIQWHDAPRRAVVHRFVRDGSGTYVHDVELGSPDAWSPALRIVSIESMGDSVLVSQEYSYFCGAVCYDEPTQVHLYSPNESGELEFKETFGSDRVFGAFYQDSFGHRLAANDDTFVVGDPISADALEGRAYAFIPDGAGGFTQTPLVFPHSAPRDEFGREVQIDDAGQITVASKARISIYTPDGLGGYTDEHLPVADPAARRHAVVHEGAIAEVLHSGTIEHFFEPAAPGTPGYGAASAPVGARIVGPVASLGSQFGLVTMLTGGNTAIYWFARSGTCNGLPLNVVGWHDAGPENSPTEGADVIAGWAASTPSIDGLGGDDVMCATGGERLVGGPGNDRLFAADVGSALFGSQGDDMLVGGEGRDRMSGGPGRDQISGGPSVDKIWGGGAADTIDGGGGSDRIWGGSGPDAILGGSGADRIFGEDGDDVVSGGGGKDTIYGGAGDDDLQGNHQSDKIYGEDGDDILRGAKGKDRLYGGPGDDELYGGDNSDLLDGGDGTDLGNGQRGNDNPATPDVVGCIDIETPISC